MLSKVFEDPQYDAVQYVVNGSASAVPTFGGDESVVTGAPGPGVGSLPGKKVFTTTSMDMKELIQLTLSKASRRSKQYIAIAPIPVALGGVRYSEHYGVVDVPRNCTESEMDNRECAQVHRYGFR